MTRDILYRKKGRERREEGEFQAKQEKKPADVVWSPPRVTLEKVMAKRQRS